jgi:hypothetical protein
MTETIRYSRIGAADVGFGTGTFETTLADGRVVVLEEVNASHLPGDQVNETVDATQLDVYRARRGLTGLFDFDQDDDTTTGLTWGYTNGMSGDGTGAIAAGTVTLTANSTNYVEYDPETGTIAVNTSAFSPTDKVPIRKLVTNTTAITTNTDVRPIWRQNVNLQHGQCKLTWVSTSSVRLDPLNGNRLIINGTTQTIPAAGVSFSSAGLSTSTTYYLYAYMNSSTMTLEGSTTAPTTSSTDGVYIKTGDQTRTYVGAVDTNSSGDFETDIRNWFPSGVLSSTVGFSGIALTPQGYLAGLTLSNNGSDATNDIDITAGVCRDSTNAADLTLGSSITKRLDATWAVGTNQGGLDTGSIANTTYHVWLIKRSDTGVVDALFSTSASSPTMPSSYDYKRRIGSIVRTGGAIKAFVQKGDEFLWTVAVQDLADTTSPGTTAADVTLTVPVGIQVEALVSMEAATSAALNTHFSLTSPDVTNAAASSLNSQIYLVGSSAGVILSGSWQGYVRTSTSAIIRRRCDQSSADVHIAVATNGYRDRRGRDD